MPSFSQLITEVIQSKRITPEQEQTFYRIFHQRDLSQAEIVALQQLQYMIDRNMVRAVEYATV